MIDYQKGGAVSSFFGKRNAGDKMKVGKLVTPFNRLPPTETGFHESVVISGSWVVLQKAIRVLTGHMFLLQITDGDSVVNFDVSFFISVSSVNYQCYRSRRKRVFMWKNPLIHIFLTLRYIYLQK